MRRRMSRPKRVLRLALKLAEDFSYCLLYFTSHKPVDIFCPFYMIENRKLDSDLENLYQSTIDLKTQNNINRRPDNCQHNSKKPPLAVWRFSLW